MVGCKTCKPLSLGFETHHPNCLHLGVHHERPSPRVVQDDGVVDGQRVVGQAVDDPLPDLHLVADTLPERAARLKRRSQSGWLMAHAGAMVGQTQKCLCRTTPCKTAWRSTALDSGCHRRLLVLTFQLVVLTTLHKKSPRSIETQLAFPKADC